MRGVGGVNLLGLEQRKPILEAVPREYIFVQNLLVVRRPCFYGVEVSDFRLNERKKKTKRTSATSRQKQGFSQFERKKIRWSHV